MTNSSYADSLRTLADLLDANPQLSEHFSLSQREMLLPLSYMSDPKPRMAEFIRAGKAAGLPVAKEYDQTYGTVFVDCGAFRLQVYATRSAVCEKVVKGTREITREIPDPDAPKITVTETVEDVEWICAPLLAEATS